MLEEGKTYKNLVGNEYIYLYRSGNVLTFSLNGEKKARHISGKYRWGDKETEKDIIDV